MTKQGGLAIIKSLLYLYKSMVNMKLRKTLRWWKKLWKIRKFATRAAIIVALTTTTPSCNNSDKQDDLSKYETHLVVKGETIRSLWNTSNKNRGFEEFFTEFIKLNKDHDGITDDDIDNDIIKVGEIYFMPMAAKSWEEEIDNNEEISSYLERYKSGKKYYLEKYEKLGNKKLKDIYANVKSPELITVDNGMTTWWDEIKSKIEHGETNVKYVILHSTCWVYDDDVKKLKEETRNGRGMYAHFFISQDGKIYKILRNGKWKMIRHAGESQRHWEDMEKVSLWIEVEADAGKEWTDEQYRAIQQTLKWIAENIDPDIKANQVLTHSQVAKHSVNWRWRKSDPRYVNRFKFQPTKDGSSPIIPGESNRFYNASENGDKYLFPNNYTLFDPDVAKWEISPNWDAIQSEYAGLSPENYENMISWLKTSKKVADHQ